MNKPKDSDKDNKNTEEWHFSEVMINRPIEEMPPSSTSSKTSKSKEARVPIRKERKLTLDVRAVPRTKTRSAMAMEMQGLDDKKRDDLYDLAPISKRAVAFILDSFFLVVLLRGAKSASPVIRSLIQFFLDKYKLQFIIPETLVLKIILGLTIFGALFFFILIPVSFYNHSFGKKMLGLKIRGEERYTLSIFQALKRELIMKPISIAILAGFITPFYNEKRQSIHDKLTHTFVIED